MNDLIPRVNAHRLYPTRQGTISPDAWSALRGRCLFTNVVFRRTSRRNLVVVGQETARNGEIARPWDDTLGARGFRNSPDAQSVREPFGPRLGVAQFCVVRLATGDQLRAGRGGVALDHLRQQIERVAIDAVAVVQDGRRYL